MSRKNTAAAQKSVAIQNLGCSKNLIDGERILALFASNGFSVASDASLADIIIVNTCAFIKEAKEEAIDTVLEMGGLKKSGRCKALIVSGCFSERYRGAVKKEFPEVDVWAGVDDWGEILSSLIRDGLGDGGAVSPSMQGGLGDDTGDNVGFKRVLSEPLSTQHIKIAEGCSHKCSFCVIPSIRGKFKSRSVDSIIQEADWLYGQGARELILVAQDTSFYGRDIGANLVKLLESLLKSTDFPWIRMMYLHPQFVSDGLLSLIAAEPRLCRYFDIPLQHISDAILASMNRSPLSRGIYKLIERIRTAVGGAALRTSFIIGFPGETEKEFGELKNFIQFAKFDKLGVFPFSPEEGTQAYAMRPRPKANTVQRRCDELMSIQQEISREILEAKVGIDTEVIIDRISDDPDFNYEARTRADAPEVDGRVFVSSGDFEAGRITTVKIIGASDYDLYA
ncbi:MAG: 30S ribosomal protein S12 methylthiotransferase RimO [Chitinispirillales bacterium]|nr:30S ribosomal protein S12 methylthiotransferase RimO [Chitinispirillales bacterium]